MRGVAYLVSVAVAFIAGAAAFRSCGIGEASITPAMRSDTVVLHDTVRVPVPAAEVVAIVRYDTVWGGIRQIEADGVEDTVVRITPENDVLVPISRSTYRTDDYTAIVEGYRPRLVSMEIYRKTSTVTNIRSPRWALTLGPGVGYGPHGLRPYVGVSAGFVLWSK